MEYILYIQLDTVDHITIFGREWVAVLKLKGLIRGAGGWAESDPNPDAPRSSGSAGSLSV